MSFYSLKMVKLMAGAKRRKPNPRQESSALRKNSKQIVTEITGTILAAAIFAATMWSSVFGMTGAFDHQEAIVVAEVMDAN